MSEPKVLAATFSDFRVVKGRKVVQWILESPIENLMIGLEALGPPGIATDNWCMIQPIEKQTAEMPKEDAAKQEPTEEGARLVKQCAIHCADVRFQQFLANTGWISVVGDETAAEAVRKILGVKTRADLATNDIAQVKWKSLHAQFRNSLADKDYGTGGYMR